MARLARFARTAEAAPGGENPAPSPDAPMAMPIGEAPVSAPPLFQPPIVTPLPMPAEAPPSPAPSATVGPPSQSRMLRLRLRAVVGKLMGGMYRSPRDRLLGGVAGGLGERFRQDPVLFRAGFIVLATLGLGIGAVLYLAAWLLLPLAPAPERALGAVPGTEGAGPVARAEPPSTERAGHRSALRGPPLAAVGRRVRRVFARSHRRHRACRHRGDDGGDAAGSAG